MANVEKCICCGEIIPEGRHVCSNCMTATGKVNEKPKKKRSTIQKDIWYNFLCGWFVGMAVLGHLLIGLCVVILMTDGNANNLWCVATLLACSVLVTFGILRYLGKGGK